MDVRNSFRATGLVGARARRYIGASHSPRPMEALMPSRTISRGAACAALLIAVAVPASAQQPSVAAAGKAPDKAASSVTMPTAGLRAELIADIGQLERKYVRLAEAMKGKYDWRPAAGVRSVGEVFAHVAGANMMLPTMAGVRSSSVMPAAPAEMRAMMEGMRALEKSTDEAAIRDALAKSFTHAKEAVAQVPDDQLEQMTKMFGRDATKRNVLSVLVTHMHEHLGQAIAYARQNGVTPPWSEGGE
jgi:uncharacterized damage-inducible protein DinB